LIKNSPPFVKKNEKCQDPSGGGDFFDSHCRSHKSNEPLMMLTDFLQYGYSMLETGLHLSYVPPVWVLEGDAWP